MYTQKVCCNATVFLSANYRNHEKSVTIFYHFIKIKFLSCMCNTLIFIKSSNFKLFDPLINVLSMNYTYTE